MEGLEERLAARGYTVVRSPLIETRPLLSSQTRDRARELLDGPWILFTSPAGVEAWRRLGLPFRGVRTRIGVVGAKTAAIVKRYGGEVALVGEPQNAEGLAEVFAASPRASGPVGLPRGDRALPTLEERLTAHGFEARPVVVYQTVTRLWGGGEVDAVVLSSPSAAEALPKEIGSQARLVALGPSTGAAIAERGWRYAQAERPDAEALVEALERLVTW